MKATIEDFIRSMPKAELHLHIEGSFEPGQMFEIAKRNNVPLKYKSVDEVREAYKFGNLQEFLDIYYAGAGSLLHEIDFYELTMAYLEKAHKENIVHAEIFFDPQTHTARGIEFSTVINGIWKALVDGENKLGITSRLIMCFLRHLDEADAFTTLQQALPFKEKIVAVGLDSSEFGHPPAKFERVFAKAREYGFLTVAHAGEEGPAAYVKDTIELLKVSRIDHGNRCLEDPALVKTIAATGMPLTVCPLSNYKLSGVKRMEDHPLRKLMEGGLKVTVNSDDPAYFGGYVNDNYIAVQRALGLTRSEIVTLAGNSFEASFIPESLKKRYMAMLQEFDRTFVIEH